MSCKSFGTNVGQNIGVLMFYSDSAVGICWLWLLQRMNCWYKYDELFNLAMKSIFSANLRVARGRRLQIWWNWRSTRLLDCLRTLFTYSLCGRSTLMAWVTPAPSQSPYAHKVCTLGTNQFYDLFHGDLKCVIEIICGITVI